VAYVSNTPVVGTFLNIYDFYVLPVLFLGMAYHRRLCKGYILTQVLSRCAVLSEIEQKATNIRV